MKSLVIALAFAAAFVAPAQASQKRNVWFYADGSATLNGKDYTSQEWANYRAASTSCNSRWVNAMTAIAIYAGKTDADWFNTALDYINADDYEGLISIGIPVEDEKGDVYLNDQSFTMGEWHEYRAAHPEVVQSAYYPRCN